MHIEKSTDYELIHIILTDPKLYNVTGNSEPIDTFVVSREFTYLLIKDEDKVYGCFQIKKFNNTILEAHINIKSKFWGTDISVEASELGFKWVKDNTDYLKLITDVPVPCEHVHILCKKIGWNPCGLLKNSIVYKGNICDLILYDYDLRAN